MSYQFRVIDLFAGPGGLAEGFSSVVDAAGRRLFNVVMSVEKERSAHRTLTLRAFTRQFPVGRLPASYYAFANGEIDIEHLPEIFPKEWAAAEQEALCLELGDPECDRVIDARIDEIIKGTATNDTIVIGGPPCQAYSLAGRSRNAGNAEYRPEEDERHFLYKEYIRILERVEPAAFVMENVKGMLSSSVSGNRMFDLITADLQKVGRHGYKLVALAPPLGKELELLSHLKSEDFIVNAERYGVPQARHRVFVIGIREDIASGLECELSTSMFTDKDEATASVEQAIGNMPKLRSGLSRKDEAPEWRATTIEQMKLVIDACSKPQYRDSLATTLQHANATLHEFTELNSILPRRDVRADGAKIDNRLLQDFIVDPKLEVLQGHESRGHMPSDLGRYFFAASFAEANGRSPSAKDFPEELRPNHKSWSSGKFADRFRVQVNERPASTIVSHIAKDGHYFIHPDPLQCRSLTVREAARLQTFPDNYLFLGNRTQQYVQVGNAVPPYLAMKIASALSRVLKPEKSVQRSKSKAA